MIHIIISNEIRISGPEEEIDEIKDFLAFRLTFNNPEYISAKRAGRYISGDLWRKRYIRGWREHSKWNVVYVPNGFFKRLKEFCRENDIRYKVKDRRVEVPRKKKLKYSKKVILRPYQNRAVNRALRKGGGIIQAPCGSGKTQIIADLIRRINQRALILVHTDDLMKQMQNRIEEAFGVKVGIIKQDRMELRPITIASVMTLRRRELSESFLNRWGVVVLDEVHHQPAESFMKVMSQFPAKHRFGATATTRRKDALEGMMYAIIGQRIFNITYKELYEGGWLMPANVHPIYTDFVGQMMNKRDYGKMVKRLTLDVPRNQLINDNLMENSDHYNLILSSRIEHLEILHANLIETDPSLESKARMLIGRMKGSEREEVIGDMRNGDINYIFATQLADEGLDLPRLDRLHLVFPSRAEAKIQQQIGRIQRTFGNKDDALCYDFVDGGKTFSNQASARRMVYKDMECEIIEPEGVDVIPQFGNPT